MKRMDSANPGNKLRSLIGALMAFGLAAAASPLHAAELTPVAGESLDLGDFHGVVYYTSEKDGYRVVATVSDGEGGPVIRFSATLADNQSATISVPGQPGGFGRSVEIARSGDRLVVTEPEHVSAIAD
jgi:hypothetical protein